MSETKAPPPADLRKLRYDRVRKLLKKWSSEDPAYDTMVMDQLRQAVDLKTHCEDRDEASA